VVNETSCESAPRRAPPTKHHTKNPQANDHVTDNVKVEDVMGGMG